MGEEKREEAKEEEEKKEEGNKEEKKEDEKKSEEEPQEIVLKVDMHCEACARKVARALKGFQGVEEVTADSKASKVVVKGKTADPIKVCERIQKKSGRKVELISPLPKPPSEDKKEENKEAPPPQEKKEEGSGKQPTERGSATCDRGASADMKATPPPAPSTAAHFTSRDNTRVVDGVDPTVPLPVPHVRRRPRHTDMGSGPHVTPFTSPIFTGKSLLTDPSTEIISDDLKP